MFNQSTLTVKAKKEKLLLPNAAILHYSRPQPFFYSPGAG